MLSLTGEEVSWTEARVSPKHTFDGDWRTEARVPTAENESYVNDYHMLMLLHYKREI